MVRTTSIALLVYLIVAGIPLHGDPPAETDLSGDIPRLTDAPPPLSPEESRRSVALPEGFRLELIASEPLVQEPTGVCWDEQGRMFVTEVHGFNLEGHFDIVELNKTGQLDRTARMLIAGPEAHQKARDNQYGTVKRLIDTDGDGRMDRADVWADRLPPCFGVCPARGGVIVVCSPAIIYLADRDGDGSAEVRETLYTGFETGDLERRNNCPQWGPDNWIYVGKGSGGRITGPRLAAPVDLPNTDFRIKPDGTAIEPITGRTRTIGFAFTETGERFIVGTRSPAIYIAPLPWRYLARNPDAATPRLWADAVSDLRVYPTSTPHPWRRRRADDPEFADFLTDLYGVEETSPNGYFTSGCSSLVYHDTALPGLRGHILACEPAQNMIYRAQIDWLGVVPRLRRVSSEQQSEFLAATDPWFNPIALSRAPDGTVVICDFYREIIEHYSAVPRYLQQQYGLRGGEDLGRIWRLTHRDLPTPPSADVSGLNAQQLAREIESPYCWRRATARRLLVERVQDGSLDVGGRDAGAVHILARTATDSQGEPGAVLGALYTLDGINLLAAQPILAALDHENPGVRVHALQLGERRLDHDDRLREKVFGLALAAEEPPAVLLQLALTLGESDDARVVPALARLAREHGEIRWMSTAILCSLQGRSGAMLTRVLESLPERTGSAPSTLLEPLCATIAAGQDGQELSVALTDIVRVNDERVLRACLRGIRTQFENPAQVQLSDSGRAALNKLAGHEDQEVRTLAKMLVRTMQVEDRAARQKRLAQATRLLADIQLPPQQRLDAVAELAVEIDPDVTVTLLDSVADSTPQVREMILAALFARGDRLPAVVEALESKTLPTSALTAVQRSTLMNHPDAALRDRAAALYPASGGTDVATFRRFTAALDQPRNLARGEVVFREKCATCHRAHGVGVAVGPDLSAEFRRAEETIIKDILSPGDVIAPGYVTYAVQTNGGRIFNGLMAGESPGSIRLREAGGKERTILRKDIDELRAMTVSMMPEELASQISPEDAANVITWLRSPPERLVLLDDEAVTVEALDQGEGAAALVTDDRYRGTSALRITPPQKFSARIDGWHFAIRENPRPGEFRYLRFAWKSAGASGVMLELASDGNWPPEDEPRFRYHAGPNNTGWQSLEVAAETPRQWTLVTRDLWRDFGDTTITGMAPTATGGPALFDAVELWRAAP